MVCGVQVFKDYDWLNFVWMLVFLTALVGVTSPCMREHAAVIQLPRSIWNFNGSASNKSIMISRVGSKNDPCSTVIPTVHLIFCPGAAALSDKRLKSCNAEAKGDTSECYDS